MTTIFKQSTQTEKFQEPNTSLKSPNNGSIISVVGKTTVKIIELFEYTQKVP